MKPLTTEQAEKLFDLIDKDGSCPGLFFGESVHPDNCPYAGMGIGEDDCKICVGTAIMELRVTDQATVKDCLTVQTEGGG